MPQLQPFGRRGHQIGRGIASHDAGRHCSVFGWIRGVAETGQMHHEFDPWGHVALRASQPVPSRRATSPSLVGHLVLRRRTRPGPLVEKTRKMLSACGFSWELVLVGNYIEGSDDETPRIVGELAARWPNTHAVIRPKEGMMGWDMRMGLDVAHRWRRAVSDRGRCRLLAEGRDSLRCRL